MADNETMQQIEQGMDSYYLTAEKQIADLEQENEDLREELGQVKAAALFDLQFKDSEIAALKNEIASLEMQLSIFWLVLLI